MHEGNEDKPSSVRAILEQIKMFEQHVKPRELFYTFEKKSRTYTSVGPDMHESGIPG